MVESPAANVKVGECLGLPPQCDEIVGDADGPALEGRDLGFRLGLGLGLGLELGLELGLGLD